LPCHAMSRRGKEPEPIYTYTEKRHPTREPAQLFPEAAQEHLNAQLDTIDAKSLSIVVPIFNVGRLIVDCLDSLRDLSLAGAQIVLVNDGSTDDSMELAMACSEASWIIITQPNAGLAAARNRGLNACDRQFVCFIDSDDKIKSDVYLHMLQVALERACDAVFCDYQIDDGTGFLRSHRTREGFVSPVGLIDQVPCVPRYIYNRVFLAHHRIQFPAVRVVEDLPFHYQVMAASSRIWHVDAVGYTYRVQREGSLTSSGMPMQLVLEAVSHVRPKRATHVSLKIGFWSMAARAAAGALKRNGCVGFPRALGMYLGWVLQEPCDAAFAFFGAVRSVRFGIPGRGGLAVKRARVHRER